MRYIDADALIKKMFPLGMGDGMYVINAKAVKFAIDKTPTADVVPKIEYDAVVSAVDNSTKEFLKLHDDYQKQKVETDKWKQLFYDAKKVIGENAQRGLEVTLEEIEKAKAEAAREIFEEIEKIAKTVGFPEALVNGFIKNHVLDGMYLEREDFDNLKKKCTEEKS